MTTIRWVPSLSTHLCRRSFVQLPAVGKAVFRYEEISTHIAVVGPDGFQLCTSLQVLRLGWSCSHAIVALFTWLQLAAEFNGDCIQTRW